MEADAERLVLADKRVRWMREIVARQSRHVTDCETSGRSTMEPRNLLRLFEGSLAIFEDHAALLRAPQAVPLVFRR